jgi:hypothetical protein
MKQLMVMIGICLITPVFGASGHEEVEKMKTIFQCGEGTESGFKGWKISGLSHKTITYFEKDHIEFFQEEPGQYSVGFVKRLDELVGYTDLRLTVEIEAIENCVLNYATAYFSTDGKTWEPSNTDARRGADIQNDKMDYSFVKIVADLTLFNAGRFQLKKASVYGSYKPKKIDYSFTFGGDVSCGSNFSQTIDAYEVFSFDKKVNIETKDDKVYQFILTNTLGQVMINLEGRGSQRFEVDLPPGIYFVSIVKDDKRIITRKVVL